MTTRDELASLRGRVERNIVPLEWITQDGMLRLVELAERGLDSEPVDYEYRISWKPRTPPTNSPDERWTWPALNLDIAERQADSMRRCGGREVFVERRVRGPWEPA